MVDWEVSQTTWHTVPFPEHYAEVMLGRDGSEVWTWETERVHSDGMDWDTASCIWLSHPATGPFYTKDGYDLWRWVDPRHPRCWYCGRFFRRDRWVKGRFTGPCPDCDEGPYPW